MKKGVKHILKNRNVLAVLLIATVYFIGEVYVYTVAAWSFNSIECHDELDCTRILFVADPQLIGLRNEIFHPITPLSIFDIDRYLFKTFQKAAEVAKPHVIVFLGDLFDEGSVATDEEFVKYVDRFWKIYGKPTTYRQHIWIPGDNDIGGEGADFVTADKIRRFGEAFRQLDVVWVRTAAFHKINRLTHGVIDGGPNNQPSSARGDVNVGLSHISLLSRESIYTKTVLSAVKFDVLFTGHEHHAAVIEKDREQDARPTVTPTSTTNRVHEFSLGGDKLYEIMVPTASYRMGTAHMGHGFAVLEKNRLRYTVLWSPSRFPVLLFYAVLALCATCYCISKMLRRLRRDREKKALFSV